jgi:glutamyl-tRNA reductase
MPILALGVSFRRAPFELLERLTFAEDDLVKAYRHALDLEAIDEAVILSTCNRVEVYASVSGYHAGFLSLKRLLTETRGVNAEELAEPLYAHWERDAEEHLFGVAGGLDSMVLGETQIQTQVREALRKAIAEGAAGPQVTALFHAASRTGRRIRQETSLGAAPDAFVELGANLAAEALAGLADRDVVVIGAGQMASLAAKHLRSRGVGRVRILNRSREHAKLLAQRTSAEHGDLFDLPLALADADLVVSATGAAGTVLGFDTVAAAMTARQGKGLVVLDLAVPRDVDPAVATIAGVRAIDIETLRQHLYAQAGSVGDDVEAASQIVQQELRRSSLRKRSQAMAPLIAAIHARGEDVMRTELERHNARLAQLTPDERAVVESLARGIVAKLLHDPVVQLKERSAPGADGMHAKLLAELFGLSDQETEPDGGRPQR